MTPGPAAATTTRPGVGVLAVVGAAVLWGTTGTATHFAPGVSAIVFGAVTFGVGGLVLAATHGRATVRAVLEPGSRRWVWLGAASLVVYAVAFYVGLAGAGIALGTTIAIGSSPVFAGVVEWLVDRRPVGVRWVAATVVSIAGMVVVVLARADDPASGSLAVGVAAALVAGATYALYTWAVGRGMRRSVSGRGTVGAVFGLAAVPLVVLAVVVGYESLGVAANWPVFLYLALVPTVLGHSLYALGLRSVRASAATLVSLLEPVVAAVLAVLVVGEHLGPAGWTGVALVVFGVGLLAVPARARARALPVRG